jgi:hypothetical protein
MNLQKILNLEVLIDSIGCNWKENKDLGQIQLKLQEFEKTMTKLKID